MSARLALLALGLGLACAPKAGPPAPASPEQAAATVEHTPPAEPNDGLLMPTAFDADRIFLELRTAGGQPLRLFTDTGGGLYLQHALVERLGLPLERAELDGQVMELVTLPPLDPATPLPPVLATEGRFPVAREDPFGGIFGDGMLGQAWFRGRVWTFDYRARSLRLHDAPIPCNDGSEVPLGFQARDGQRTAGYPRIQAEVDGTAFDLLFDTGATVLLTETGHRALGGDGPLERATSFIVRSVFERWREAHPDWRIIEAADRLADDPMIEVPAVKVGEVSVGPVWFTARADPNFHEYMMQWMDKRVDGALGGSALRHLRVTVDYPAAVACVRPG